MQRTIADKLRDEGRAEGIAAGRTEGIAVGRTEGFVQGRAEALLDVLRYRAVPVSDDQRRRVLATRNEHILRALFARAFVIGSADELFDAD
ncbi:MAG: hypothetical protein AAGF11_43315 [Myxococcota bacterium]